MSAAIAGVAIGAGTLGMGIYNSVSGGNAPKATQRSLADEVSQLLALGPDILKSDQELRPDYTQLNNEQLRQALFGRPASTDTSDYWLYGTHKVMGRPATGTRFGDWMTTDDGWVNTKTGQFSATVPQGMLDGSLWSHYTNETTTPGDSGLLGIYKELLPETTRLANESASATREATYGDIRRLNPANTRLADLLTQAGAEDVALGSRLTDDETGNIRRAILGDASNRGWGFNPGDMARVGMETGAAGEARRADRLKRGQSISDFIMRDFTLPALGYAPNAMSTSSGMLGESSAKTSSPNILSLLGSYASDLNSSNQNASWASSVAGANARNSAMSGLGSSATGLLGSLSSLFL